MFKVKKASTIKIWIMFRIKKHLTTERCHLQISIVNFEHFHHSNLMFLLLTLSKQLLNPEEHSNPELFAKMRNNRESVFIFAKCSIVLLGSQYTPEIIFKVIHKIELTRYRPPWTIYSQIYYETSNIFWVIKKWDQIFFSPTSFRVSTSETSIVSMKLW